jgi:hypothetical protein
MDSGLAEALSKITDRTESLSCWVEFAAAQRDEVPSHGSRMSSRDMPTGIFDPACMKLASSSAACLTSRRSSTTLSRPQ